LTDFGADNVVRRIHIDKPELKENKTLSELFSKDPATTNTFIIDKFASMVVECKTILNASQEKAKNLQITGIVMAFAGTAAGTIAIPALVAAAPVANQVATSALGGVSGSLNAAQYAMQNVGLTPQKIEESTKAFQTNWDEAVKGYNLAPTPETRVAAIDKAQVICIQQAMQNPDVSFTKSIPEKEKGFLRRWVPRAWSLIY
jgi:hypothetical protein